MFSSHLSLLMLNCFLGVASVRTSKTSSKSAQDRGFPESSPKPFADDLDGDAVSHHMSRLYEKYSRESRLKGNTVRSFRASRDSSDHRAMYHLNLTSIQESEVTLSATFHFLLERIPHQKPWFCKRFKSPSCRSLAIHPSLSISLLLHSVSPGSGVSSGSMGSFLGNVTLHPHRRGVWQMKDVTQVIKEARNKGHLLVSLEFDFGKHYQKKTEEAPSTGNMPYLLVYAKDRALEEPNSVASSLQRYDPLAEGGEPSHSPLSLHILHRPEFSPELKGRVRREATLLSEPIQNNELPEVEYRPDGYRKDDLWESTWYLALKPKIKSGSSEKKRKSQKEDGVERGNGASDRQEHNVRRESERTSGRHKSDNSTANRHKAARTLVTDGDNGRKNERRMDARDGKKHKVSGQTQSLVLNFDEQTMRKARKRQWGETQQRGCSRRSLRVDFADIGWSEWVILPKAFDAFYCSGTCGFPMPKVLRPSNHATIQSIVQAVGIIPGVPEPCCVPEMMSPLAVLYHDESSNLVLKIYPNMSVQSCSCR